MSALPTATVRVELVVWRSDTAQQASACACDIVRWACATDASIGQPASSAQHAMRAVADAVHPAQTPTLPAASATVKSNANARPRMLTTR
jgi:hypothetical protein